MASSSSSNSDQLSSPPTDNPLLSAYEDFVRTTPAVTRTILSAQVVSYIVSWFVNPYYALANISQYTVFRLEVYRLFLSPLVNTNIIALLFAFLSFAQIGKRLEHSFGSTSFAWLCTALGFLTNVIFTVLTILVYLANTNDKTYLFVGAEGIWLILFGLIAMESVYAPRDTERRLFCFDVPTLFFPLALYMFWGILNRGNFSLGYMISVLLGYGLGFGHLDSIKLNGNTAKKWEESFLSRWTNSEGWIPAQASRGTDAWVDDSLSTSGGGLPMFRRNWAGDGSGSNRGIATFANTMFRGGQPASETVGDSSLANSSTSGGRTLGGATRRGTTDARTARLEALDRNAQKEQGQQKHQVQNDV